MESVAKKMMDWMNWFQARNGFTPTRLKVPQDVCEKLHIESRRVKRLADDLDDPCFPRITFCGIPVDQR